MRNQKRVAIYLISLALLMLALFGLASCGESGCEHDWEEATCTAPKTCKICYETMGEPLAHTGGTATCRSKAVCTVCGTEYGTLSTHSWVEATCAKAKHCSVCSVTEGEPSGQHTEGVAATCTQKAKCAVCEQEYGTTLAHTYTAETVKDEALKSEATCTSGAVYYKSCSCGAVSTNDADTFTVEGLADHRYTENVIKAEALKTEATCKSGAVYYKSCVCGAISTDERNVFTDPTLGAHKFTLETVKKEALKSEATCKSGPVYYKSCACGEISKDDKETFVSGAALTTHSFTEEIVKPEALQSAATCSKAAVYYKSCACGEISKNAGDTFFRGGTTPHSYTLKTVKAEALKSAATCGSAAVYYKSCSCGSISTSDTDTFTDGAPLGNHSYTVETVKAAALKSAATCTSAAVYYKSCSCGAISTNGAETFTSGSPIPHSYTIEMVKPESLKKAGTCTTAAVYYKSCACGAISNNDADTFTGDMAAHAYVQEIVKTETLKSAATCTSVAVYYKSCVCGAISTSDEETFTSGTVLAHTYVVETVKDEALKSAATCTSAAVYYKSCACGAISTSDAETFSSGSTLAHTYTESVVKAEALKSAANCTDAAVYYKSCTCGAVSTNEADTFTNGTAVGHAYVEAASTEATCGSAATKTYQCGACGDSYTENEGDALSHDISDVKPKEELVSGCEYVLVYTCKRGDCGDRVEGKHVFHHEYVASITTVATCQEDGEKTLVCACGDTKVEPIEHDATGHNWVKGTVTDGVRTDTCSYCGDTKSVTVYEGTKTEETKADDLKDKEIELNDANISLDDGVIDSLGSKDVTVSAEKVEGDDRSGLGLSANELAQVGNSPIYNFTINDGTENISQFGENNWVTITLPYTLSPNEDVDSIAVWFINDEGKLESIKATYNNGYVTFKTNHFSYYTVTRLTPVERCALYGCNHVKQIEPGSCTEDAYTLYVCVRCHASYKDDIVVADGHDYEEVTTAATCTTNGSTVYTCKDCDHSYTTKLNATGHSWSEEASTPATCAANGYTQYGCANCDEEYTETHEKLAHRLEETVVAATCETAGYTLHDCKNCDYSETDTYVAALGHKYEVSTWTWAEDYSTASLKLICKNDATHEQALNANIGATVFHGICSDYTETTYTAAVSYNGVAYTDEKVVLEGTPNHTFSDKWSVDKDVHWRECICGTKTDEGKHSFENDTVTKPSTCVANGESTATCVCGETKVTVLPATNEHIYADGVCTSCGREEGACDHKTFETVRLDLSQHGVCAGEIVYSACSCGMVKFLSQEMDISCDFDESPAETTQDENGNKITTIHYTCSVCQLEAVVIETVEATDGCAIIYTWQYSFAKGDTVILDRLVHGMSRFNHAYEKTTINLADHGACDGVVTTLQCKNCGDIEEIQNADLSCEWGESVQEDILDSEGNIIGGSTTDTCTKCGLVVVEADWIERESACESLEYDSVTLKIGEETVFAYTASDLNTNHQYEYTYEMNGETCEDGYKVNASCSVCGMNLTWYGEGHRTEWFEQAATEYGFCRGSFAGWRCTICDYVRWSYHDVLCFSYSTEEIVDEEGNVHRIMTGSCETCGGRHVLDEWFVEESACMKTRHLVEQITIGDQVVVDVNAKERWGFHDWNYTVEKYGETCADGYHIYEVCAVCGAESDYDMFDHFHDERTLSPEETGLCGTLTQSYCVACEEVFDNYYDDACGWRYVGQNNEGQTVYQCDECGGIRLRYVGDVEYIGDSCEAKWTEIEAYYVNDKEVFRNQWNYSGEHHEEETEIVMYGKVCTDGYSIVTTCKNCDYRDEEFRSNHYSEAVFILGLNEDVCDSHSVEVRKCCCGYSFYLNINGLDYDSDLQKYVCADCDLVVEDTRENTEDGCSRTVVKTIVITVGENELYRDSVEMEYANHTFAVTSSSLTEEALTIHMTCSACGATKTYREKLGGFLDAVLEEQDKGRYFFDYTVTPDADGVYTITSYSEDDTYVELYELVDGELVRLASNDDGGMNTNFLLNRALVAGKTYVYRISFLNSSKSGTISFSFEERDSVSEEETCEHSKHANFAVLKPGATSCEEGVWTGNMCTYCGRVHSLTEEKEHVYNGSNRIELTEHGACRGSVTYYTCACGKSCELYVRNLCGKYTSNEYYDEAGKLIYVETRACDDCGLRYSRSYYSERDRETCTETYYYTVLISLGEAMILQSEYIDEVESHDHEITGTLLKGEGSSCEDGVLITYQCKDCDYEYSNEIDWHENFAKEEIRLSDSGSVCGGYVTVYGCICGRYNSLDRDHWLCDFGSKPCELWIENAIPDSWQYTINGYHHFYNNSYIYTCSVTDPAERACTYKIRYAQYWMEEGNTCVAYQYQTWQFGYNEETGTCVYEITFKTGSISGYHNYTETRTETDTHNTEHYDCADCGSYYHFDHYYDAEGKYIKWEQEASNTVNDGNNKYYNWVEEFAYTEGGTQYVSRNYEKRIYADGEEWWYETKRTGHDYTGPFGENGFEGVNTYTDSDGESETTEIAYVYYRGYQFYIYEYYTEGEYWHKYDYSYSFDDGCIRTTVYTNSNGETETTVKNICRNYTYETILQPTCSQVGKQCNICVVCDKRSEPYDIVPLDHAWTLVAENWYCCRRCGMENANGASGSIIMEDLTETLGNGENYVVGYYAKNEVTFTYYVSLFLADETEVILDGVEFSELEGKSAIVFSKAAVAQLAAAAGYADSSAYHVRFAFVPYGDDGSFDYAVTFTETAEIGVVRNSISFVDYVGMGETVSMTIVPDEDGTWTFTSNAYFDTVATLTDADGQRLAYNDDGDNGLNFKIVYDLKAGETYTISVKWHGNQISGYMPLIFNRTPVETA